MITLSLFLLLPLPMILNRWRGTGVIFTSIPLLNGTRIYALYLGLLVGYLSTYYYGILISILFILGECFGWGKWVGYLTDDKPIKNYNDLEGRNFPFIHQVANYFIKEKEDYLNYCRLALSIRGFIWWTPILILLGYIDLINWYQVIINSIILSVGFPIACEIGKRIDITYNSKYLNLSKGWENQEIIYGFIQFLCITFSILICKVYNGL